MTGSATVAGPGRKSLPTASHRQPTAAGRATSSLATPPRDRSQLHTPPSDDDAAAGHAWRLRLPDGRELALGDAACVMGVVNVTPDSFSDGGLHLDPARAADRALRLLAEGAALVDLGAESTRPGGGVYGAGAATVSDDEECLRLIPVLRRLRRETAAPLSVDTRKASVARAALDEGADLVNDVSALSDPEMAPLVASRDVPIILMHSRGELGSMQRGIHFDDVVAEVRQELAAALAAAADRGIARDQTLVDPGLGFGKNGAQNLELLARLDALASLGRPIVVGASRKSFIGHLTGEAAPDRLAGSLAAAAWAASGGARMVRAHDVAQTVRFLRVWTAIAAAGGAGGPGGAS